MKLDTPLLHTLDAALHGSGAPGYDAPWLGWLTVALCRQRARQDWLAQVLAERLQGLEDSEGDVPGLPQWRYDFHGRGLCLQGPGRECLDVDFYAGDTGPQTIDPHFFITRVLNLDPMPPVEQRLQGWFGGERDLLVAGLKRLRQLGVLTHPTSRHVFHLHPWLEEHYGQIAAVDFDDAAVASDWAERLSDHSATDGFVRWGLELLQEREHARIIGALAPRLPVEVATSECLRLLTGPVDYVTGQALNTLRTLGAVPGPEAIELMERLDPEQHNPFSACALAEWLLVHGETEVGMALVQRFARQRASPGFRGNPFDAEYAVLALRFAPEQALTLVRQALRSRTPDSVKKTAALLSLLDAPWCRVQLLEAIDAVDDSTHQRFFIGCLMHSADAATRRRARALLPPPPEFGAGVGYTYEEVEYLNLRDNVVYARERAAEVVALLRPN